MINYSDVSLGISLACMLICITNIVYIMIHGRTDKVQNKLFIVILGILTINAICGLTTAITQHYLMESDQLYAINQNSRYIYFLTHTALCPVFFYYIASVNGVLTGKGIVRKLLYYVPFILTEVLVFTNPWTNLVWYYDENRIYHRNTLEMTIYAAALYYYIWALIIVIFSWGAMTKRRRMVLIFLFFLVASGVLIQLLFKNIKVEVLSEAVGFTGVLMTIENEDDRLYGNTNYYNRGALGTDLKAGLIHNRVMTILVIKVLNPGVVAQMTGSEDANTLPSMVAGYLVTLVPRYHIYVANQETMVVTLYDTPEDKTREMAEMISQRFEQVFHYADRQVPLSTVVLIADLPEQISSVTDAFHMIDNPILEGNEKKILRGEDLDYLIRRSAVESAVSRGLQEGSFEVYYQPTYHIDQSLHGAEALLRMHDKELGNLYPDEFIPVAEQIGMIDSIDDFVLEEVCRFISSGTPAASGMDCINVNLSVIQCMKPDFVEHITGIVEKYGVDKHFINFEITESVAASDYKFLGRVIQSLKKNGFMFSMDDYGTGYSNVAAILSLDFDVVKIDKSILWGAETSELGLIILENTIHMVRQMKKQILVEGVETLAQIELLTKLGVDYLQGFYYSKPIPKQEFIAKIQGEAGRTS